MSSKHNRRKRRALSEPPVLVERLQKAEQNHNATAEGQWKGRPRTGNYEVDNWPWLSPEFRAAHNRRLQAKGLPTIPPPLVDLYVRPATPAIRKIDSNEKDFVGATREFLGQTLMGGGDEGFTVNGHKVKL